ncbi:TIGR03767 family metallophosphoesterase [Micromonospora chersina]|uniref:TIGR03767 family metallophosphoesterase n=1 Tax=Micromonospora chersina TaxID=47854 RepID=UPI0037AE0275
MEVSRRSLLALVGASVVATALDVGGYDLLGGIDPAFADVTDTPGRGLFGGLTTLDAAIAKGNDLGLGYRRVVTALGERHVLRADLAPSGYGPPTLALGAFAQMTDLHVVDDKSPGRVEFTDRLADAPQDPVHPYPTGSAYRPHETMSTHIVDAMARAIRNVGNGPMTGLPLAFTIVTGDAVDNVQYNEVRWYIDLLDGAKEIRADSGQYGFEQSVSGFFGGSPETVNVSHNGFYWYPEARLFPGGFRTDGTQATGVDQYQEKYGFPSVPGMLEAARRPYQSTGLGMPWYAAMGNHDGELQGNYPVNPGLAGSVIAGLPDISGLSLGSQKPFTSAAISEFPPDPDAFDVSLMVSELLFARVVADNDRRVLERADFAKEHLNTSGLPRGHGFSVNGDTYYTIPSGDNDLVKYITLDTVNYDGNAGGQLNNVQFDWLEQQLKAYSKSYLSPTGAKVTNAVADRLIVIFCHHTLDSMNNDTDDLNRSEKYSDDLKLLLARFPNVILLVNGHTHRNRITPRPRSAIFPGTAGGYWEVSTASHIDWPVQSRIIEIAASPGLVGTISIFTTIVDIDAPLGFAGDLSNPKALASLARELAANDPTERLSSREGSLTDRNTQLLVQAPFPLPAPAVRGSSIAMARNNSGTLEVFGTRSDDTMWSIRQNVPGVSPATDVWSAWASLAESGFPEQAVAAQVNSNGTMELAAIYPSGAVKHRVHFAGGWSGWSTLNNADAKTIAMARNADGRMQIFVTTASGGVSHITQAAASSLSWGSWVQNFGIGIGIASTPIVKIAAEANADGRIEVFGLTQTGGLVRRAQDLSGGWGAWTTLGTTPVLTAIAVAPNADGRLQLFGVDHDRKIWYRVQTSAGSGTYSAPIALNGRMTQLAAETNLDGRIELFGVDVIGSLWHTAQAAANSNSWGPWRAFSGKLRPDIPTLPNGSTIGIPPAPVTVPSLIGVTESTARSRINAASLVVGAIRTTTVRDQLDDGKVRSSNPSSGETVSAGTTVDLSIGVWDGSRL